MRGIDLQPGQVVALLGHQPAQALALAAEHEDDPRRQVERLQRCRSGCVQADDPVAAPLQVGQGAAEIDHLDQRHEVERARGRLGTGAAELGAAAVGQDDALRRRVPRPCAGWRRDCADR